MTEHNTFIERPIISHDGADDSGVRAEVKVQRGLATVDKIDEKKSRPQVRFQFASDNLEHGVGAWVNKESDEEIYNLLKKAYDEDFPVFFRTEKKRKAHVDRKTPINEITLLENAKENSIHIIAGVRASENDEWIESSESVTLPSEDSSTGSVKATASNAPSGEPKPDFPWGGDVEAPPYKTRNSDKSVNPGSDAVAAVANTYTFIHTYLTSGKADVTLDANDDNARKQVFEVTNAVISLANRAQMAVYDGKLDKPAMSKRSHTRARSLIFHAMENTHKLTQEHLDSKEKLNEWAKEVFSLTVKMWKWSIDTVDKIEG